MMDSYETFRHCKTTIPLSFLKVSHLYSYHSLWFLWISKWAKLDVWTMHVFPNLVTYKESRSHPAMVIVQLSESMLMGQQVNTLYLWPGFNHDKVFKIRSSNCNTCYCTWHGRIKDKSSCCICHKMSSVLYKKYM